MLPKQFEEYMNNLLGVEASRFFEALDKPEVKSLSVDFNKITQTNFESICDLNIKKIPYIDNGYHFEGKVGNNLLWHAGIIYSQDSSAMLPVIALDVEEKDIVLDMCSAPGGKSVQILQKLNNTGLLIANEVEYSRAKILYENLTKTGYNNFAISNTFPNKFADKVCLFDKILVDAPCSGEGMFRRNDINTYHWNTKNVETCAVRQLDILNSCKNCLKDGGKLVYSTCTYNLEENEKVVCNFLSENPDYTLIDLPKEIKENTARGYVVDSRFDTTKCGRRYPHLHKGEGQFIAVFKRKTSNIASFKENYCDYIDLYKKDKEILDKFLKDVVDLSNLTLKKKSNNIYAIPRIDFDYSKLNILCLGTVVGTLDNNNIKLNHSFYKAYPENFYNIVNLSKPNAEIYLTGNVVEVEGIEGISSVMYNGVSLGGGKVTNGVLKNYYPKNLRTK